MRRWFSALGCVALLVYVVALGVAIADAWGCSIGACIGPWLWFALPWIDMYNPYLLAGRLPPLVSMALPWLVVVWPYVLNAALIYLAGWLVEAALRGVVRLVLHRTS